MHDLFSDKRWLIHKTTSTNLCGTNTCNPLPCAAAQQLLGAYFSNKKNFWDPKVI